MMRTYKPGPNVRAIHQRFYGREDNPLEDRRVYYNEINSLKHQIELIQHYLKKGGVEPEFINRARNTLKHLRIALAEAQAREDSGDRKKMVAKTREERVKEKRNQMRALCREWGVE
jgi:hypothetical protein